MPMIHKVRFFASLDRAPHMRPPVCLLYAMWTVAASMSDEYSCYEDLFYERTRRYIQEAEMKVGNFFCSMLEFDFGHLVILLINIGPW